MGTNELCRSISIEVYNLESQFALLAKVIDNFEMVGEVRVQVIMNNFRMVYLQPISLVGVPLHFKDSLCVRFVSALVEVFEITALHEYLDDSKLGRRFLLLFLWVFRIFHSSLVIFFEYILI